MGYLDKIKEKRVRVETSQPPTYTLPAGITNFSDANQEEIYWAMKNAIRDIAAVYSPDEHDSLNLQIRKELALMPLETLDDIARWRAGWLKLVKEYRSKILTINK